MDLRDSVEDINTHSINDAMFNFSPLASRKHPVNSGDLMNFSDSINADSTEGVQLADKRQLVVHPTSTDTLATISKLYGTVVNPSTPNGSKYTPPQ